MGPQFQFPNTEQVVSEEESWIKDNLQHPQQQGDSLVYAGVGQAKPESASTVGEGHGTYPGLPQIGTLYPDQSLTRAALPIRMY